MAPPPPPTTTPTTLSPGPSFDALLDAYLSLHELGALAEHASSLYASYVHVRSHSEGHPQSSLGGVADAISFLAAYFKALEDGDAHAIKPTYALVQVSREAASAVSETIRKTYPQTDLRVTADELHAVLLHVCADFKREAARVAWLAARGNQATQEDTERVSVVEAAKHVAAAARLAPLCESARVTLYKEEEEREVAIDIFAAHARGLLCASTSFPTFDDVKDAIRHIANPPTQAVEEDNNVNNVDDNSGDASMADYGIRPTVNYATLVHALVTSEAALNL